MALALARGLRINFRFVVSLKPQNTVLCVHHQHLVWRRNMSTDCNPSKKMKTGIKIGTHNGSFHCDEVLACSMLKRLPRYQDAEIVRTRDQSVLDTCDIVVDVGGVFDAGKHRYDHHQRSFAESMSSLDSKKKWVTKLSSAGLIYFHFGLEIVSDILNMKATNPVAEIVYNKVYENFVEEIDAIDNGINQFDGEPRYQISTTLSNRVRNLNPAWNEEADEQVQFMKAMELVGAEFLDRVLHYKKSWLPARTLVEEAISQRKEIDESGEIVVFKSGGCPWRDHLFNIEEEQTIEPKIKYVLYTDNSNNWRIQCVPLRLGAFENRLSLPAEWRGIRDEELSKLSGIPGCIFVHNSGFIGGNKTYEGALKMGQVSLKTQKSENVS